MAKNKVSDILKDFNLTDDQVLELAIEPQLTKASDELIRLMWDKWNMDKLTAMKTIESLRSEFK